jgi:hypothetical protein
LNPLKIREKDASPLAPKLNAGNKWFKVGNNFPVGREGLKKKAKEGRK